MSKNDKADTRPMEEKILEALSERPYSVRALRDRFRAVEEVHRAISALLETGQIVLYGDCELGHRLAQRTDLLAKPRRSLW